jgi:hypothetical protein
MKKTKRIFLRVAAILAFLYLVLLIPDSDTGTKIIQAGKRPFFWNNDALWQSMELQFKNARQLDTGKLDSAIKGLQLVAENNLEAIQNRNIAATDKNLTLIKNDVFNLASLIAARPAALPWLINYYDTVRTIIKIQSQQWDMKDSAVKNSMYALLYGMRAAVEEVLLQADTVQFPAAMLVQNERSATPSTNIFGTEVHSGDMLVSRGGAEVSALISRGNDYPGNFSHVALIYVEEKTSQPYLIEAHIEKGVAISTVAQYVKDKKLRFMVMRVSNALPAMKADPMLPQKAATMMYKEALSRHIPYDFKMNFYDSSALFCSEVASYVYRKNGIQLWKNISTISSQGVVNWLKDFGVENFVTQMPSDLEYDPQLAVVAEWRNPETLYKDHIDNAVMDAMLEKANSGATIGYAAWQLPFVRVVKAWCLIKNEFGKTGIIPEGMSATRALKNQTFVAMYAAAKNKTVQMAADFIKQNGYRPPYWQLVKFATAAVAEK